MASRWQETLILLLLVLSFCLSQKVLRFLVCSDVQKGSEIG